MVLPLWLIALLFAAAIAFGHGVAMYRLLHLLGDPDPFCVTAPAQPGPPPNLQAPDPPRERK